MVGARRQDQPPVAVIGHVVHVEIAGEVAEPGT